MAPFSRGTSNQSLVMSLHILSGTSSHPSHTASFKAPTHPEQQQHHQRKKWSKWRRCVSQSHEVQRNSHCTSDYQSTSNLCILIWLVYMCYVWVNITTRHLTSGQASRRGKASGYFPTLTACWNVWPPTSSSENILQRQVVSLCATISSSCRRAKKKRRRLLNLFSSHVIDRTEISIGQRAPKRGCQILMRRKPTVRVCVCVCVNMCPWCELGLFHWLFVLFCLKSFAGEAFSRLINLCRVE